MSKNECDFQNVYFSKRDKKADKNKQKYFLFFWVQEV